MKKPTVERQRVATLVVEHLCSGGHYQPESVVAERVIHRLATDLSLRTLYDLKLLIEAGT